MAATRACLQAPRAWTSEACCQPEYLTTAERKGNAVARTSIWSARPSPQMSDSRFPRPAAASVDSPSLAPNWFSISSPARICALPPQKSVACCRHLTAPPVGVCHEQKPETYN